MNETHSSGDKWAIGGKRFLREADAGAGGGAGSGGTPPPPPPDWRASLPEDLRAHESLKDFKDVAALAKSHVETKAMVGNSLRLPGPDAGAEDKKAFVAKLQERFPNAVFVPGSDEEAAQLEQQLWDKLGRPKDAKGYDFKDVDLGGAKLDLEDLAKTAAAMGWTKAQAKAFAKGLAKHSEAQAAAVKAAQDALKKEWGAALSEKTAAAAETARKLGAPPAMVEAIKAGTLPLEQMKYFDAVATAVGGSGRQVGDQGAGPAKLTPEEAQLQLEEVYRRYYDPKATPAEQEVLKKKILTLMPQAHPGEADNTEVS
jgi:hypothetical protein